MQNVQDLIKDRRTSTYRKLKTRFVKSLHNKTFDQKSKKQRRLVIDRIKDLESQLGLRSNLRLKHWALAATLGFISIVGHGQDKKKEFEPFYARGNKKEIRFPQEEFTSKSNPVADISNISIFEPQPALGDPLSQPVNAYGDFDGDGDLDIVSYSYFGSTKILLNDSFGFFDGETVVRSQGTPGHYQEDLIVSDIDNDGDDDIIITEESYSSGTNFVILENNGSGSFSETSFAVAEEIDDRPILADMDGDGDMDLTARFRSSSYDFEIRVYENNANTFSLSTQIGVYYPAGSSSMSVEVADIDNDGDLDLVTLEVYPNNYSYPYIPYNIIRSYANDGSGNFSSDSYENGTTNFAIYPNDEDVMNGDLDGNSFPDLVAVSGGAVVAFFNSGSSFSVDTLFEETDPNISRYFEDPKLVDIDGDGDLDIAMREESYDMYYGEHSSGMAVLSNDGTGAFTMESLDIYTTMGYTSNILPLDIDGDSDLDLIASNSYDITVFENEGANTYSLLDFGIISVVYGLDAVFADVDGDGDQDVINTGLTMVLINDGFGNLSIGQNIIQETGEIAYNIVAADLDDDGDVDLIMSSNNTDDVKVWKNDGSGQFSVASTLDLSYSDEISEMALSDVDGDGDLDLIGVGYSTYSDYFLGTQLNDGDGNFTQDQFIQESYELDDDMKVGDIDGDLDDDVIATGANGIVIFLNNNGVFETQTPPYFDGATTVEISQLELGDIDGDGDLDIIAMNEYEGGSYDYILRNNGSGSFSTEIASFNVNSYGGILLNDLDLDGDLDLFIGGGEYYKDEIWQNDGTGNFSLVGSLSTTSYRPAAGDIDGDGDTDFFITEYYRSSRVIINNTNIPVADTNETDSLALVDLYNEMGGANWGNQTGWLTDKVTNWHGITVDSQGRVTAILLPGNNVQGGFPDSFFELPQLTQVDLNNNPLFNNALSFEKWQFLTSLEYLNLNYTGIAGIFGSAIGNMTNLQVLELVGNRITELPAEITQLSNLTDVYLQGNDISELPDLSGIQFYLDLSSNRLFFDDIIPLVENSQILYANQKTVPSGRNLILREGSTSITLDGFTDIVPASAEISYQWFYEGDPIDGANTSSLNLSGTQLQEGTYHIEAQHSQIPGLILESTTYLVTFEKTYYWVGNGGNWYDLSHWSSTSGVTEPVSELPDLATNVIFDENSFSQNGQALLVPDSVNRTRPQFRDMDWSAVTNSPTLRIQREVSPWIENYCWGSLILSENMTVDNLGAEFYFGSNEDYILDTKGHFMGDGSFFALGYDLYNPNEGVGTAILQSDLNISHFYLREGDFISNGNNISADMKNSPDDGSYFWIYGDSVNVDLSGSFLQANNAYFNGSGMSLSLDGNSTIRATGTVQNRAHVNLGNVILYDSTRLNNVMSFGNLNLEQGATILMDSSVSITNEFVLSGTASDSIRILSSTEGEQVSILKESGVVNGSYLYLKDNIATGGAEFNAYNSKNGGNVTGWNFLKINSVSETDSLALVGIYKAFGGESWTNSSGWLESPVAEWYGVGLNTDANITEIRLPSNNLEGKLDQGLFANLVGLKVINLEANKLTGGIPTEFFALDLEILKLNNNELSSEIPAFPKGHVSTLRVLDVSSNQFYGKLFSNGSFPALETLLMNNNLAEGEIILPFDQMPNLRTLQLNNNLLEGSIPGSISNLEQLSTLNLSNNVLIGTLPQGLTSLPLTFLNVSSNQLEGSTSIISQIESLTSVSISNNQFTELAGFSGFQGQLLAQRNFFDFGDFQSLGEVIPQNISLLPQDSLYHPVDSTHNVGEPITISFDIGGTGNVYQWIKDGQPLQNATSSAISIDEPDSPQEGTYVLRLTNPQYEGVTLFTSPFVLKVGSLERDKAALLDLLANTSGFTPENWSESNALDNSWEGVQLNGAGTRVEILNLPASDGNVFQGFVPPSFADLTGLQSINLSGHELTAFPNISGFPSLSELNITRNRLSFKHIVPNVRGIENFTYAPQRRFGETIYDTLAAGGNIFLQVEDMGRGSNYVWRFGRLVPGKRYNDNPADTVSTARRHVIGNINFDNQGTYRAYITNPDAPDLTLETRNKNVMAATDIFGTITKDSNPLSTGGEVFIWRQTPSGPFVKEDSTVIETNGDYKFEFVVLGNFVVQVKPDRAPDTTVLQTYYVSAENYRTADTLKLRDRTEGIDIEILKFEPRLPVPQGAMISGFIESDFDDEVIDEEEGRIVSRRKVRKAGCSMRRFKSTGRDEQEVETEIAYYIETDDEGYFNFEGVEPGKYLINIEFPGVPMNEDSEVEFVISEDKENQVFEVDALITELGIEVEQTEILFNWKPYVKEVQLYPNPTEGNLGIDYLVYRSIDDLKIQLISIAGSVIIERTIDHSLGSHQTQLDLTDLGAGMYFLIFTDEAGTFRHELKVSRK